MPTVKPAAVMIMVVCWLLSGCAAPPDYRELLTDGSPSETNPRLPQTLRDGGVLALPMPEFPETLNPLRVDAPRIAHVLGSALYPRMFASNGNGSAFLDTTTFPRARIVNREPQVVSIEIDHRAMWTDGTPITWRDLRCQVDLLSGRVATPSAIAAPGFDRIESVTRGADEREALITFKAGRSFREWQGLFAPPYVLLPCSVTSRPDAFEASFAAGGVSAGPFRVTSSDSGSGVIELSRNADWWGDTPRLDAVELSVTRDGDALGQLMDGFSAVNISSDDALADLPGSEGRFDIRSASQRGWVSMVFNSHQGRVTGEVRMRRAITKAIDREQLAVDAFRGLTKLPLAQDSDVFLSSSGAPDESWRASYDPVEAGRELDALGWHLDGDSRTKGGVTLTLRVASQYSTQELRDELRNRLSQAGIGMEDVELTGSDMKLDDVDAVLFDRAASAFPIQGAYFFRVREVFAAMGCCGETIDRAIETASMAESAEDEDNALAEIDQVLWQEARVIPLVQIPEVVATREDLANFGAFGAGTIDYTAIGFTK